MRHFLITLISLALLTNVHAQQNRIKVVAYNLLNFPNIRPERISDLKTIVKELDPDVFLITELNSKSGAENILTQALNSEGTSKYKMSEYVNGPDSDNLLYYNHNKLGLIKQKEVATTLRNISEYVLYYKSPTLNSNSDTTYLYCYMAHLKASKGADNEAQRNQEAITVKSYMSKHYGKIENVIFAGDFNMYSSSEAAHASILNHGLIKLIDPINKPGDWNNNYEFADIHTQSTRRDNEGDGGSSGGCDDRFDIIFTSSDVMSGTNGLNYIPNSYLAYGNDGNHYNKSINERPNNAVSNTIADALFSMSDHLPIVMEFEAKEVTSISETERSKILLFNKGDELRIKLKDATKIEEIKLYNAQGKQIYSAKGLSNNVTINTSEFSKGKYIINIKSDGKLYNLRFLK